MVTIYVDGEDVECPARYNTVAGFDDGRVDDYWNDDRQAVDSRYRQQIADGASSVIAYDLVAMQTLGVYYSDDVLAHEEIEEIRGEAIWRRIDRVRHEGVQAHDQEPLTPSHYQERLGASADHAGRPGLDTGALSNSDLIGLCIWQLAEAAAVENHLSPRRAEMMERAKGVLATALERPAVLAAFAASFSHPQMVAVRLEAPTPDNLNQVMDNIDLALEELSRIRDALVDQHTADEMRLVADFMSPLDGPRPWDTFYTAPGKPNEALMPLHGWRTPEVLALGPIGGGDQLRSPGGQALFYPLGGYDRFAEASTVVVVQTLADGVAIDDALQGDETTAVIVASAPEGVLDVCFDVNRALVNRAAIAAPGERDGLSLVAALTQAGPPHTEATKRLALEGPRMGTSIIRPTGLPGQDEAGWRAMAPDDIAGAVLGAEITSLLKLEAAAEAQDERLDFGSGFRQAIRELRAANQETIGAIAVEAPMHETKQTRSLGRRM